MLGILANGWRAGPVLPPARISRSEAKSLEIRYFLELARLVLSRLQTQLETVMQSSYNLFTRPDTFFGVCEGLGEDLRIPANLLRIAFAAALFFNPQAAIATYLGLGILIAAVRWFVPNPSVTKPAVETVAVEPVAVAETEAEPVLLAA